MVAGFTRQSGLETVLNELVFSPTDIDELFVVRGIDPPNGTTFDIVIQRASGAKVTIGQLGPSDGSVIFQYKALTFS